jgi:RNA polymerase sigma-70 factor (ECF subfamily)
LPATDAELITASLRNGEVFAKVYDRHAARLYRYAARRLGAQAAEDVVSEAMLAALKARTRYDATRPDARPWLFGILTREISRRQRAERRRYRAVARMGVIERDHPNSADQVAAVVMAHSARAPLAKALADLATRDRDVLLLVAWADMSYQEVADALDIPIGTVRSRLHRARRQIRASLHELGLTLSAEEAS